MSATTTTATILERLAARASGPGYGLARILHVGDVGPNDDMFEHLAANGVQVLAECSGALGVLRGLELRCGPVLRSYAESGEEIELVHWSPRAPRVVHRYTVRVHRDAKATS